MTITGKVRDGGLYFDSASEWLKALAPFEGKAVEVVVRDATVRLDLRQAAIHRLRPDVAQRAQDALDACNNAGHPADAVCWPCLFDLAWSLMPIESPAPAVPSEVDALRAENERRGPVTEKADVAEALALWMKMGSKDEEDVALIAKALATAIEEAIQKAEQCGKEAEAKLWIATLDGSRDFQSDHRVGLVSRILAEAREAGARDMRERAAQANCQWCERCGGAKIRALHLSEKP